MIGDIVMRLKAPLYAQIELTMACPLQCNHCYNPDRFSDGVPTTVKKEPLKKERFPEIAKILANNEVFAVTLTGGEILTVRDRLYPTIEVLAREGLEVTLNSSLFSLRGDDVLRLKDSGITGVMTSLMSYNEETHDRLAHRQGAHRQTVRGIEQLQKNGISVAVNMVVSQNNKHHVYPTGTFLASLGVTRFQAAQAVPSTSGGTLHLNNALSLDDITTFLEDVHRLREKTGMFAKLTIPIPYCSVWEDRPHLRYLLETSTCTAGRSIIQITPDGNVEPCPMVEQGYGNILEEDLSVIWDRMHEWEDNVYVPESCQPCDLVSICRGGCRAEAEREVGSLKSKHPYSVKPVKLNQVRYSLEVGSQFSVIPGIRARQEDDTRYVLYSQNRFMIVNEGGARFIRQVQKEGGLYVDSDLARNNVASNLVMSAYHSGILGREN